jgi:predicted nucleic acid-binding protein
VKLVVDASAVVPCFVPERFSAAARRWLEFADVLLAPEFLALECANALWKKMRRGEITQDDATSALTHIGGGLIKLRSSSALALAAFQLGSELDHPVYDCTYVALAEAENAGLLTADRKLVQLILASRPAVQAHWVAQEIPSVH